MAYVPTWPRWYHTLFLRVGKARSYRKTASFFWDCSEMGSGIPKCPRCGHDEWLVEGVVWKERSEHEAGFPGSVTLIHKVHSIRCAACGKPHEEVE